MSDVIKKRNWAFVLYPDSAPDDWRERLKLYGVRAAVSPLHDKDIAESGDYKKAHYHILLCYPHPTTQNNVLGFVESLKQNRYCEPIQDLGGYYRYLTHSEDPDKAQYKFEDITTYCGFKAPRDKMDYDDVLIGVFDFIRDNQITSYAYLVDCLSGAKEIDMLSYVVTHAYAIVSYLRSACDDNL